MHYVGKIKELGLYSVETSSAFFKVKFINMINTNKYNGHKF